jgi:Xaa-Pro aminopeptidase
MLSIAKTVPELSLYSTTNDRCPIEYEKSIKNPTEIEYFRKYLKIDSIALAIVLAEVEKIMSDPAADLTEYEVAEMLMETRANLSRYESSFSEKILKMLIVIIAEKHLERFLLLEKMRLTHTTIHQL